MDKKRIIIISIVVLALIIIVASICIYLNSLVTRSKPEDVVSAYMTYLVNGEYERMYELIDQNSKNNNSQEVFVSRNKNIYTGIEARNIMITNMQVQEFENRNSRS